MFITLFNLQGTHHLSAVGFYLTTLSNLCQALFSSFLTLLCRLRFFCGLVAVATVLNFTTSFSLCQELFSSFSKLFVLSSAQLSLWTALTATVSYLTTSSSSCQELFSSFFKLFRSRFAFAVARCLPRRFHILPRLPAFVKNFFRLFSKSFSLPQGFFVSDALSSRTAST